MPLLSRANEQSATIWRPVPEGLWRWVVGSPELKAPDKFPNYQVKFPLGLTGPEQARLVTESDPLPPRDAQGRDTQQSYRVTYTCGLSLGYIKAGQFQSTRLIDFLAACLGNTNTKKFRDWIAAGGGPPRPADRDDQKAELSCIESWLEWWENLELYGTVSHATDTTDPTRVYARFAGPMAVGSLPGQKDDDYQALGRGKLRAIIVESQGGGGEEETKVTPSPAPPPPVRFTAEGVQVRGDGSEDMPF